MTSALKPAASCILSYQPESGTVAHQSACRSLGYSHWAITCNHEPTHEAVLQVVVATPGRLWELMQQGHAHLTDMSELSFFVLDEADRMVQQGHFQVTFACTCLHIAVKGFCCSTCTASMCGPSSGRSLQKLQSCCAAVT